jgi:hypothetical protein
MKNPYGCCVFLTMTFHNADPYRVEKGREAGDMWLQRTRLRPWGLSSTHVAACMRGGLIGGRKSPSLLEASVPRWGECRGACSLSSMGGMAWLMRETKERTKEARSRSKKGTNEMFFYSLVSTVQNVPGLTFLHIWACWMPPFSFTSSNTTETGSKTQGGLTMLSCRLYPHSRWVRRCVAWMAKKPRHLVCCGLSRMWVSHGRFSFPLWHKRWDVKQVPLLFFGLQRVGIKIAFLRWWSWSSPCSVGRNG